MWLQLKIKQQLELAANSIYSFLVEKKNHQIGNKEEIRKRKNPMRVRGISKGITNIAAIVQHIVVLAFKSCNAQNRCFSLSLTSDQSKCVSGILNGDAFNVFYSDWIQCSWGAKRNVCISPSQFSLTQKGNCPNVFHSFSFHSHEAPTNCHFPLNADGAWIQLFTMGQRIERLIVVSENIHIFFIEIKQKRRLRLWLHESKWTSLSVDTLKATSFLPVCRAIRSKSCE